MGRTNTWASSSDRSEIATTMPATDSRSVRVNASTGANASDVSTFATITHCRPSISSGANAAMTSWPR